MNNIDPSGNMLITMAMPNYGSLLRAGSAAKNAMGPLDKLDAALTMLQMVFAYNQAWTYLTGLEWQNMMKNASNQQGFISAMSDFDSAIADLANKSGSIFRRTGVTSAMREFIASSSNLLIYGPTPETMGGSLLFPHAQVHIGTLSLSKTHRKIILEVGVRNGQGGRMLGVGHQTARGKNIPKQWFRQDWHNLHPAGDLCFHRIQPGHNYHYHCAKKP